MLPGFSSIQEIVKSLAELTISDYSLKFFQLGKLENCKNYKHEPGGQKRRGNNNNQIQFPVIHECKEPFVN